MKNKMKRTVTGLVAFATLATGGVTAFAATPDTLAAQPQVVSAPKEQTVALKDRTPTELKEIIANQPSSTAKTSIEKLLQDCTAKTDAADAAQAALIAGLEKYGVKDYKTSGNLDTAKVEAAIKNLKDKTAAAELTRLLTDYTNAAAQRDAAKPALVSAMEKAGYNQAEASVPAVSAAQSAISVSKEQTVALKDRTPDELAKIVNDQPSSTAKTSIEKLLQDYTTKAKAADTAQAALIAGLEKYGIKDYKTNGNIDAVKIEAAIKKLNNKTAAAELTRLLTSYTNAAAQRDAAKAALVSAMEKADYNKKADIVDVSGIRNNIELNGGAGKEQLLSLTDGLDKLIQEGTAALNSAADEQDRQEIIDTYGAKFEAARADLQKACDQYGLNLDIPTEWYA